MSKIGRSITFDDTMDMTNCHMGLEKQFDNKAVILGSNFVTSGEVNKVELGKKRHM